MCGTGRFVGRSLPLPLQGNGALEGADNGVVPMELIETLRNISVQEAFAKGRSVEEISDETGLSVREVPTREIDIHLVSANDAAMILRGLSLEPPTRH
jgi:hypothetical protein